VRGAPTSRSSQGADERLRRPSSSTSRGAAPLINAEDDKQRSAQTSRGDDPTEPQQPVRVLVSELLAGGREAILVHGGQDYRLRITANGKLILTK
jgi:hemin uptake protein HemP